MIPQHSDFSRNLGVQSYNTAADGQWTLVPHSRIILVGGTHASQKQSVTETIATVRQEYDSLLPAGWLLPVVEGNREAAAPGDLLIELDNGGEAGTPEGYRIEIDGWASIYAKSARGLMYGLRTTLSLLAKDGYLLHGTITDYPSVPERALHIDIGRKYYSPVWIMERIKEMSYLKLNTLQLHFSENEGFALMSDTHPEVMSDSYLTKEEVREILSTARKYHVSVIPSLDSPGHLGHALRTHPEWLLQDAEGNPARGALDITNAAARQFVMDLIDEYTEVFAGSTHFHIGGDEFIDFEQFGSYPQLARYAQEALGLNDGTGIDTYIDYLNGVTEHLEGKGFTVRAWNDGLYRSGLIQRVPLKPSVEIAYWTQWHPGMAPLEKFVEMGHKVINYNDAYLYYVLGEHAGYKYPVYERIRSGWHPGLFPSRSEAGPQEYHPPYPPFLIGSSFSIWSDIAAAQTEEEVAHGICGPLRAMAELAWLGHPAAGC